MLKILTSAWQGKASLSSAFWGNFFIGQFFAAVPLIIILSPALKIQGKWYESTAGVLTLILYFAYFVWAMVGIWRCSKNTRSKLWSVLARAFTLLYSAQWALLFVYIFSMPINWKDDWHPACKVASFFSPAKSPYVKYAKGHSASSYSQTGNCKAVKVTEFLWFVKGDWNNKAMEEDGIPPVKFEAVMFEDNDKLNLHVQRSGTQYSRCSIAIDGVDKTYIRYNHCGEGGYIFEFKKNHNL